MKKIFFLLLISVCLSYPAQSQQTPMPEFRGIEKWYNSPPLSKKDLNGKVVIVDFWAYTCINCLRSIPHLVDFYNRYKDQGLIIVGVQSPEFEFEQNPANVELAIKKLNIPYPVALDNQMATWTAFHNNVWPAHYFIDGQGLIRGSHLGEGDYDKQEEFLRQLLAELPQNKGKTMKEAGLLPSPDFSQIKSPETYLGFARRAGYALPDQKLDINHWTREGSWQDNEDNITLKEGSGKLKYHFNANKVNLVVRPITPSIKAIIRLDGKIISDDKAGVDVKQGQVEFTEPRLYQLINLGNKGEDHVLEIEFQNPGIEVYTFTFG